MLTPTSTTPVTPSCWSPQAALTLRRDQPHLFTTYLPVRARGEAAEHVLAFDRGGALTVATRLPIGLAARGWGETVLPLPEGAWADLLTGREHSGDAPLARAARGLPGRPPAPGRSRMSFWTHDHGPFAVWVPRAKRLRLSVGDAIVEMTRSGGDWWIPDGDVPDPTEGPLDYGYLIDDSDVPRPDPRSRRQPAGVHERSRTYDPTSFPWTDRAWTGRQLPGSVIYELHVGTFTPDGTLDAAIGSSTTCARSGSTSSS